MAALSLWAILNTNDMTKTEKTILISALLLAAGAPMCLAAGDGVVGEVTVIVKKDDGGTKPSTRPRMPAYRPLTCMYDTDTGLLTVSSRNQALSSVQVQNLTTGEMFSDQCFGYSTAIYLSGTSGIWQVTITLEDGSIYIGMFNL